MYSFHFKINKYNSRNSMVLMNFFLFLFVILDLAKCMQDDRADYALILLQMSNKLNILYTKT